MKINELMIGDFVTFKDCQEDKAPSVVKIIALGYQGKGEENEALVSINGANICDIIEIDDEIVGIPISSEILEKNGFQYDGEYVLADDYYDITAKLISDGLWQIEYECVEMSGIPSSRVNVSYVHELQHFLQLCGSDNEIVI